jgi:hypothetical protein
MLALPVAVTAHVPLDPVAVPAMLQLMAAPVNVPVPVPVTASVPKHVAEKLPEPDRPDTCVTAHWKFAHVPAVDGAGETDDQVPESAVPVFEDGVVAGLPEQPAMPSEAVRINTATRRPIVHV